jgi:hypothetical protein
MSDIAETGHTQIVRSVAALALLVVAGLLPSTIASGSGSKARLIMVDRSPLAVRGLNFYAGEDVRVRAIVRGGPRLAKSVTTGRNGVFKARFASLSLSNCSFLTVHATGARGSRASFTLHPPPCGPAP